MIYTDLYAKSNILDIYAANSEMNAMMKICGGQHLNTTSYSERGRPGA